MEAGAAHHPMEIRGRLQLADLYSRAGKLRKVGQTVRRVEEALVEAEATLVGHPLLLSEGWFRVALVYHHQLAEKAFSARAYSAAVAAHRLSPTTSVDALLLAIQSGIEQREALPGPAKASAGDGVAKEVAELERACRSDPPRRHGPPRRQGPPVSIFEIQRASGLNALNPCLPRRELPLCQQRLQQLGLLPTDGPARVGAFKRSWGFPQ
jgi:hypothetical protein